MATDLRSKTQNVTLTRFWGGKNKGSCVQVTQPRKDTNMIEVNVTDKFFTAIQLTREQAADLATDLMAFAMKKEEVDV
tara:strand:- start:274 stop:507 length:234 start_codon:yes stop_codon:yes gene_type:complete